MSRHGHQWQQVQPAPPASVIHTEEWQVTSKQMKFEDQKSWSYFLLQCFPVYYYYYYFLIFLYPTISSSYNSKLLRIRTDELQRDKMKVSTSPGFFSKLTVCAAVLSVVRKRKWTLSPVFNTACLCFSCLDKLFFHYLKRMAYKAFPGAQDKDDTHKSSCFFVAAWNT